MRKRVATTAPQAPHQASAQTPALTAIPAGYAILPFGPDRFIPVKVRADGSYLELSADGRTGGYDTWAKALAVIAAYPAWRARQDEVERGRALAMGQAQVSKRGRKGGR